MRAPAIRPAPSAPPAPLLAAVLALAYLIWEPPSQDLAAADLPRRPLRRPRVRALEQPAWYSGHHVPSYSVLYPPLAALLGVRRRRARSRSSPRRRSSPSLARAASATGRWSRPAVVRGRRGELAAHRPDAVPARGPLRPRGAARAPTAAAGRSAALLAALSASRARSRACSSRSPGPAIGLAGERARGAWLALGAVAPIVVLNLAFPIGGEEPFVFAAFIAVPAARRGGALAGPGRVPGAADRRAALRGRWRWPCSCSRTRSAATSPGSGRCSPGRCWRSCSGRAGGWWSSRSSSRCSTGS